MPTPSVHDIKSKDIDKNGISKISVDSSFTFTGYL